MGRVESESDDFDGTYAEEGERLEGLARAIPPRALDARRLIERRQELKRLREVLEEPDLEDF